MGLFSNFKHESRFFSCPVGAIFLISPHFINERIPMPINEQELSERCRRQDNGARKVLYELYAGQMLAICMRYVANREVAEVLLHDGFLKIFTSFDKFTYRGAGSLKAWMSRIMVNLSIEYLRKNDAAGQFVELDELPDTIPDAATEEEVGHIPQEVLMKFIEELPAGYRTVFNLYTFEDKPHKEIAAMLGINEKSSASQLFRAKAVLAKRIKDYMRNTDR